MSSVLHPTGSVDEQGRRNRLSGLYIPLSKHMNMDKLYEDDYKFVFSVWFTKREVAE